MTIEKLFQFSFSIHLSVFVDQLHKELVLQFFEATGNPTT
jgi:hypothetical protein